MYGMGVEYNVIEAAIGRVPTKVEGMYSGSREVRITFEDGGYLSLWHEQDCCEQVDLQDVEGDPHGLVGYPLTVAEEAYADAGDVVSESGTWSFYRFGNGHEFIVLRWLGESNGYYSEGVSHAVFKADGTCESGRHRY